MMCASFRESNVNIFFQRSRFGIYHTSAVFLSELVLLMVVYEIVLRAFFTHPTFHNTTKFTNIYCKDQHQYIQYFS